MRARKPISHVVAFDDAPFEREHRGNVAIVGVVYAGDRLDGVLTGKVRRDGANAAREIVRLVRPNRSARACLVRPSRRAHDWISRASAALISFPRPGL